MIKIFLRFENKIKIFLRFENFYTEFMRIPKIFTPRFIKNGFRIFLHSKAISKYSYVTYFSANKIAEFSAITPEKTVPRKFLTVRTLPRFSTRLSVCVFPWITLSHNSFVKIIFSFIVFTLYKLSVLILNRYNAHNVNRILTLHKRTSYITALFLLKFYKYTPGWIRTNIRSVTLL